jgi:hypothetical protein
MDQQWESDRSSSSAGGESGTKDSEQHHGRGCRRSRMVGCVTRNGEGEGNSREPTERSLSV